jgi:hypothetical protein
VFSDQWDVFRGKATGKQTHRPYKSSVYRKCLDTECELLHAFHDFTLIPRQSQKQWPYFLYWQQSETSLSFNKTAFCDTQRGAVCCRRLSVKGTDCLIMETVRISKTSVNSMRLRHQSALMTEALRTSETSIYFNESPSWGHPNDGRSTHLWNVGLLQRKSVKAP